MIETPDDREFFDILNFIRSNRIVRGDGRLKTLDQRAQLQRQQPIARGMPAQQLQECFRPDQYSLRLAGEWSRRIERWGLPVNPAPSEGRGEVLDCQ